MVRLRRLCVCPVGPMSSYFVHFSCLLWCLQCFILPINNIVSILSTFPFKSLKWSHRLLVAPEHFSEFPGKSPKASPSPSTNLTVIKTLFGDFWWSSVKPLHFHCSRARVRSLVREWVILYKEENTPLLSFLSVLQFPALPSQWKYNWSWVVLLSLYHLWTE